MPEFEPDDGRFQRLDAWLEAIGAKPVRSFMPERGDAKGPIKATITIYDRDGISIHVTRYRKGSDSQFSIHVPAGLGIQGRDESWIRSLTDPHLQILASANCVLGLPMRVVLDLNPEKQ